MRARLRDWLALQRALALRPQTAIALLAQGASPAQVIRARGAPQLADAALSRDVRLLVRAGARGLPFGSPAYPARLARLVDTAPLLWVRGDPRSLRLPAVAVVGARAATRAARDTARRLGADLATAGLAVVSGLARGVDRAAHEGALSASGVTLAVLACGPDQVYPPEHAALAARIAERGALLCEHAPGTPPLAFHFPLRNRLISALSEAVVVVEARERSGSLITAEHAAEQGIDVLAVPGPVAAASCRGSNLLLRDGAAPVLDVDDVLRALGRPPLAPRPAEAPPEAGLPAGQRALLAALRREPASEDALVRSLGRSPAELALDLVELELAGRIARERDGRWAVRDAPTRAG